MASRLKARLSMAGRLAARAFHVTSTDSQALFVNFDVPLHAHDRAQALQGFLGEVTSVDGACRHEAAAHLREHANGVASGAGHFLPIHLGERHEIDAYKARSNAHRSSGLCRGASAASATQVQPSATLLRCSFDKYH
jgi:hypothetical protein